jgi:hypothetical protein
LEELRPDKESTAVSTSAGPFFLESPSILAWMLLMSLLESPATADVLPLTGVNATCGSCGCG